MIDICMVIGGLVGLFFGGEGLIRGAVSLAKRFGLSSLLVSAVVVGFGTSMPEMTVSVGAALKGASDIAIGNVVGSNIANILLIVGVAVLFAPILTDKMAVRRDTIVMLVSGVVLCGLAQNGVIHFSAGICMFSGLVAYIVWSYHQDKKNSAATARHIEEDMAGAGQIGMPLAVFYSVAGLGLLIGSAYILVEGAVSIARGFGISEAVIGLTIVAIGTSLPELATAVVAACRKHTDVIIGNILGSNIFNVLSILGVTSMIAPIPIAEHIAHKDVWIMLGASVFLSVYLFGGFKIGRGSGLAMLGAYIIYMVWLYVNGMTASI